MDLLLSGPGDEIIRLLNPQNTVLVLDVATGTGEPGLTIASKLNAGKAYITVALNSFELTFGIDSEFQVLSHTILPLFMR